MRGLVAIRSQVRQRFGKFKATQANFSIFPFANSAGSRRSLTTKLGGPGHQRFTSYHKPRVWSGAATKLGDDYNHMPVIFMMA